MIVARLSPASTASLHEKKGGGNAKKDIFFNFHKSTCLQLTSVIDTNENYYL